VEFGIVLQRNTVDLGQPCNQPESGIVSIVFVLAAWIAQPCDQSNAHDCANKEAGARS